MLCQVLVCIIHFFNKCVLITGREKHSKTLLSYLHEADAEQREPEAAGRWRGLDLVADLRGV